MEADEATYDWARQWYEGRDVLVVGGSSGIGAGIARGFVQAGANVTVTGVHEAEVKAISGDPHLSQAQSMRLDVRSPDAMDNVFGSFARLDCLVNCAGIIRRGAELEPSVFAEVLEVNLTGTMRCCAAARPLLAPGGTILNLASMLSQFGGGLVPGYAASKGGIVQLTKSLAIAYAPEDIRVNALAPGWVETPLTQDLWADEARANAILLRTPLGRSGQPDDLAGAALFLCSPAAEFITGAILNVDGGYSAM